MFGHMKFHTIVPFAALSVLMIAGCDVRVDENRPMQHEPVSVDLGDAERADVQLAFGAGQLDVSGGADKLLQGRFEYNDSGLKPRVTTSMNGSNATVIIDQPHKPHVRFGNNRMAWNLKLNDKVLLDFSLHCGAGQAELSMGDLTLRNVDVQMGAGQVDLDLRGHPAHDYDVNVSGGVGQATIRLPQGVGIRAEAHGGIGSVTVTGLDKEGDHWQNSLYDNSKVNVRLRVHGGIGEIRIIA